MFRGVDVQKLGKTFTVDRWKGWRRERTQVVAVAGIDLRVPEGQSLAFIGPNGAGKSTTIKMLTGILHPSAGRATVLGLTPWKDRQQLAFKIGAVFGQRSQLWYHLPPRDTFELLSRIYKLDRLEFRRTRDMLVDRFGLAEFIDTPVRKLSLGQRMRAEVAASLLHRPRVLFLDEPTIGLDVVARVRLRALIREWNVQDGLTVFLTSHDAGDIQHVVDRVVIVNHGRIVLDDSVEGMRRNHVRSKILRVRFQEGAEMFFHPGVRAVRHEGSVLELEVDTSIAPIQMVVTGLFALGTVVDIAIEEPPLEDVIAHIYSKVEPGDAGKGGG